MKARRLFFVDHDESALYAYGQYFANCEYQTACASTLKAAKIAAKSDTVVLLKGETGTGKGILARWIHKNSERKSEPFIEVNCSSLKGDLL
jgi:transcriptional regulator with GAF, ATPase, and Fis domain